MNSEIKRLEMRIKLGSGDEELDLVQSAALRDLMNAYESQIATLTAERDEARSELEDAQRQEIETIAAVINHRKLIDEQKQKIDFLTAELAALTSCPAMEEVDALVHQESLPLCERESCTDKDGVLFQRLAAIARRSIASRQEVVGLLKRFINKYHIDIHGMAKGGDSDATHILDIVEGK